MACMYVCMHCLTSPEMISVHSTASNQVYSNAGKSREVSECENYTHVMYQHSHMYTNIVNALTKLEQQQQKSQKVQKHNIHNIQSVLLQHVKICIY